MFCTNCGKEIPNESQYCKFCGEKVNSKNIQEDKKELNINKTVKVTFERKKSFIGCAVPMRIYVDGNMIAVLKNGAAQQIDIPSGKHKVIVEMWSAVSENEVEFSSEFSKTHVLVGIKMGFITNKTEILSIKNEK